MATTATCLSNSTVIVFNNFCIVGREGLEPPEPVKATDFSDIGITRLCHYLAFLFRYSVYSLYTFMKFPSI